MSPASGSDTCRITVVGPRRRVDLALPSYVPFAELFPVVAGYAGLDQEAAHAPRGWVLQRLGQTPFPLDATPMQAGLRDGELIYLRPREAQLPELAYDDVADVIATGVGEGPNRWGPAQTRGVALGAGALALLAGVVVLALSGPPWTGPAVTAGVVALALIGGAAALSRAAGDSGAGAVLGFLSLPYAFLGGALAPAHLAGMAHLGVLDLLPAFAATLLAATLSAAAVADGAAVFLGAVGASLFAVIGAWLTYAFASISPAGAASIVAAVALALTPAIPSLAFRLSRLSLPPVPQDADELRREAGAVSGSEVLPRAVAADRVVTGAVSGTGMVVAVAEIVLAFTHGWLPRLMCAVLACALLLRARVVHGRAQRLWLLVPGYGGLTLLAVASSLTLPQPKIIVFVLAPLILGAAVLVGAGMWLPGHRPSPFWGRAAEIVDMIAVISLIPLALGVAGFFDFIRGLSG
jgi:type VII secretion integral membrane protein EccD